MNILSGQGYASRKVISSTRRQFRDLTWMSLTCQQILHLSDKTWQILLSWAINYSPAWFFDKFIFALWDWPISMNMLDSDPVKFILAILWINFYAIYIELVYMLTSDALKSIMEFCRLFLMYSFCVLTCLPLHLEEIVFRLTNVFHLEPWKRCKNVWQWLGRECAWWFGEV